jgi:hypothetical protein
VKPIRHFFIPGAQRSATTYLYRLLDQHPEVEMAKPMRPEPKFFLQTRGGPNVIEPYERKYFSAKEGAWLRGEKSTSYIESESAAQAISRTFPDARLVFLLRDPVERAISNYRLSLATGLERLGPEQALIDPGAELREFDSERISASPYAYRTRGLYHRYLNTYRQYFERDHMHIVLTEQLVCTPEPLRRLADFLEIDRDFTPEGLSESENAGTLLNEDETPLDRVREALTEYYVEPNRRLCGDYGLDLSPWRT